MNAFTTQANVNMLWEVILNDLDGIQPAQMQDVYNTFIQNIPDFYQSQKNKYSTLVELNKAFLLIVLKYAKTILNAPVPNNISAYENRRSVNTDEIMRREAEYKQQIDRKMPELPKELMSINISKERESNNTNINSIDHFIQKLKPKPDIQERKNELYTIEEVDENIILSFDDDKSEKKNVLTIEQKMDMILDKLNMICEHILPIIQDSKVKENKLLTSTYKL
jgi:hypothetical protein